MAQRGKFLVHRSQFPPAWTANPVIVGTPTVGTPCAFVDGTATGTATITFATQWLLDGAVISGATGANYTPVTGDIGHVISVRRSATNSTGGPAYSFSAPVLVVAASGGGELLWSATSTWGGSLPIAGDNVVIPAGTTIRLDVNTPALGSLTIGGTLKHDPTVDNNLTATSIEVLGTGQWLAGDSTTPYTRKVNIVVNGARPTVSGNAGGGALVTGLTHTGNTPTGNNGTTNDNGGLSRGIIVQPGGKWKFFAALPALHRTTLNASANAAATSLTLANSVSWNSGDEVLISPTGYFRTGQPPEIKTLASATSGAACTLSTGLGYFRYGVMQYITDSGLSLTAGTFSTKKAHADLPSTLDERAKVANLTRLINISAPNDTAFSTNRFGVHCMIMGLTSEVYVQGVRFNRCGQGGLLGRYPFHWHMPSYNQSTGANLGNYATDKAVLRDCAFTNCMNRIVSLHGVRGAVVKDNIATDAYGHGIFLEDGSEEENTITGNWIFGVRDPGSNTWRLKTHDEYTVFGGGDVAAPSAFWITNLYNTIEDNFACANYGNGFWHAITEDLGGAYTGGCFGLSQKVNIHPHYTPALSIKNNTGHGNAVLGALTDLKAYNEQGQITGGNLKLHSTTDHLPEDQYTTTRQIHTVFDRYIVGKNLGGGYANRISKPQYIRWITYDNVGTAFRGVTDPYNDSKVERQLAINRTLNNDTQPTTSQLGGHTFNTTRQMGATYHSTLAYKDSTFIGFGSGSSVPTSGGNAGSLQMDCILQAWDFYFEPVEVGQQYSTNWQTINCIPLYRAPPQHIMDEGWATWGTRDTSVHWTLAGAIWDKIGNFGGNPGDYIIYDHPFMTYNLTAPLIAPTGVSKARATPTKFYGIVQRGIDSYRDDNFAAAETWQRVDDSHVNVSGAAWTIPDATADSSFQPMRHCAVPNGGRVKLSNPGYAIPATNLCLEVRNFFRLVSSGDDVDDMFYFGIPWSGSVVPRVVAKWGNSSQGNAITSGDWTFASTASKSALESAVTSSFWRDTANNIVWLKMIPNRTSRPSIVVSDPPVTFQLGITPGP